MKFYLLSSLFSFLLVFGFNLAQKQHHSSVGKFLSALNGEEASHVTVLAAEGEAELVDEVLMILKENIFLTFGVSDLKNDLKIGNTLESVVF